MSYMHWVARGTGTTKIKNDVNNRKIKTWYLLGEFEGRWATRRQGGKW